MNKLNNKLEHLYSELDNMLIQYEETGEEMYLREALMIKEDMKRIRSLQSFKEEFASCC